MGILVLNPGSSSLKFTLFEGQIPPLQGEIDWHGDGRPADLTVDSPGRPGRRETCSATDPATAATLAIRAAAESAPGRPVTAIGHRIVHGGPRFTESVLIDGKFLASLDHLAELAPLHNPPALKAIEAARAARPDVPHVAAFDTSFFAHLPRRATNYAVPREWVDRFGIRKYGFHGLSHDYCSGRAPEILGRDPASLRLVVCHLGNGASASAIDRGRPVDTTMGFTPLDGLMMGTRSGSVDPGALLYLMKEKGLTANQVDDALNHHSGLLGVSGTSSDYREVEAASKAGDDRATLALEIYAVRIRSAIGALAATMGGLDALAFTAGVGEHGASLRADVCEWLHFLGVDLDPVANADDPKDVEIGRPSSAVRVVVIHTREDLVIAREVRKLVPTA